MFFLCFFSLSLNFLLQFFPSCISRWSVIFTCDKYVFFFFFHTFLLEIYSIFSLSEDSAIDEGARTAGMLTWPTMTMLVFGSDKTVLLWLDIVNCTSCAKQAARWQRKQTSKGSAGWHKVGARTWGFSPTLIPVSTKAVRYSAYTRKNTLELYCKYRIYRGARSTNNSGGLAKKCKNCIVSTGY